MKKRSSIVTPNEEYIAFYTELGMTIAEWSKIEFALSYIVCSCFDEKDSSVIMLGFFSIENFRSKLKYADNIVQHLFRSSIHAAARKDWEKLHDCIEKLSLRRNKIVHRKVMTYGKSKPGRRYALLPWITTEGKKQNMPSNTPPSDAICVLDLNRLRTEMANLIPALMNFAFILRGNPAPFSGLAKSTTNQTTLRGISNLIHDLLEHKRES